MELIGRSAPYDAYTPYCFLLFSEICWSYVLNITLTEKNAYILKTPLLVLVTAGFMIIVQILLRVRLFSYDSRNFVSSCPFIRGMDFLWQIELCRRGDKRYWVQTRTKSVLIIVCVPCYQVRKLRISQFPG